MNNAQYLRTFFEEKNLPAVSWSVTGPSGENFISNEVVIEHILVCSPDEQEQIANVIRRIDFANGDVNDFLHHLAGALAL